MPFVPVVSFWSGETAIGSEQLRAALTGDSSRFPRAIVPAADADAIAGALGITIAGRVERGSVDDVRAAVRDGALGLLRLSDVTPAVRALDLDGQSLFGGERLSDVRDWPLHATVEDVGVPDQARTWTLIAGGDVLLGRDVAEEMWDFGKGADFPFDGGTARIARIYCCSTKGWPVPRKERTGNRGALREMLQGADLAIANLETAVREGAGDASNRLKFVARPEALNGVANAGIDFLSLANNHIGNGGDQGILTAIATLDGLGIGHAGAGRNAAEALAPATYEVNGVRVAIFGCDAIAPRYWADGDSVGSQGCAKQSLIDGIGAAAQDADVVIVYPHWGREYTTRPKVYQHDLARAWTAAGADIVIGAHSHWAGAIEEVDGHLVFHSLGNFVFDQEWQTELMASVMLELTFRGDQVVQAWLHPILILDRAQPNLLDAATDGKRVIDQMRDGSAGLLPY
jgi:poly-gamma-glutamate capsule biosynthesis protein CapA/YwtB (metallophosphatase superfamily)